MGAGDYWNQHYSEKPFQDARVALPFLKQMLPRLQKGKALDIAMGEGTNTVFMAQNGFQIKGFDISDLALERAQNFAREQNAKIETQKADLDLFLLGLMEYDSIIMTYFKPSVSRYYNELIRALKQGGTLLVESSTAEERTEVFGADESYRDYYFSANELLRNLKGMHILFYHEGIVNGRHVVQCLAKKPADKDAAKYNLFDMQSEQKDGGMSAQRKLAESLFKKK